MIRYESSGPLSGLVFPANCLDGGKGVCREEEVFFSRADRGGAQAGGTRDAVADLIRRLGISEVTFYRWKKQYDGMQSDQVRELKQLQGENRRLKKLVAELSLDKDPAGYQFKKWPGPRWSGKQWTTSLATTASLGGGPAALFGNIAAFSIIDPARTDARLRDERRRGSWTVALGPLPLSLPVMRFSRNRRGSRIWLSTFSMPS